MTTYGYIRVSSCSQSLASQLDDLKAAGVDENYIYSDVVSGITENKENFQKLMKVLDHGDTLVVSRWDRISRSLNQLLNIVEELDSRGVNLNSIHEKVDFSTSEGKLMLGMFGLLGQYYRDLQKQRQAEGIAAAKARGKRVGGRYPIAEDVVDAAIDMFLNTDKSVREIARMFGISKTYLYDTLKERNITRG